MSCHSSDKNWSRPWAKYKSSNEQRKKHFCPTKSTDSYRTVSWALPNHGDPKRGFWELSLRPKRWLPRWDPRGEWLGKAGPCQGQWNRDLHPLERPAGRSRSPAWPREPMEDLIPKGTTEDGSRFHGCPTSTVSQTAGWPQSLWHVHSRARIRFAAVKWFWWLWRAGYEARPRGRNCSWGRKPPAKAASGRARPEIGFWSDPSCTEETKVDDDLLLSLHGNGPRSDDLLCHGGFFQSADGAPGHRPRCGAAGSLRLRQLRTRWNHGRCRRRRLFQGAAGLGPGRTARAAALWGEGSGGKTSLRLEKSDVAQLLVLRSVGFPLLRGGHGRSLRPKRQRSPLGCSLGPGGRVDVRRCRLRLEGEGWKLHRESWKGSVPCLSFPLPLASLSPLQMSFLCQSPRGACPETAQEVAWRGHPHHPWTHDYFWGQRAAKARHGVLVAWEMCHSLGWTCGWQPTRRHQCGCGVSARRVGALWVSWCNTCEAGLAGLAWRVLVHSALWRTEAMGLQMVVQMDCQHRAGSFTRVHPCSVLL